MAVSKSDLQSFVRSGGFAWPGGYPMALLMSDGEVIDSKSVRENYRTIRRAQRLSRSDCWTPAEVFIHWEGEPLTCAHSGRMIESAYGVPE